MYKLKAILLIIISALIFPYNISAATPTSANLKVAFIGDTGEGTDFQSVLNLIKTEGTEIVFHQGDFSYTSSPTTWSNRITTTLPNVIYLGSDGNHDDWAQYAPFFQQQITKRQSELTVTGTVTSGNYAVVYKGLKVANIQENGYTTFAKDQLQTADNIWKVCAWHKNQQAMQVGSKTDERGWQLYEDCRAAGALIMTGHEHSYQRTKTLTNMTMQTVDSTCSTSTQLCVAPGKTFVVVSGLGGTGIRNQDRCLTGCNGEWAKIYTSDQGAQFGALFMIFNYQGNPSKAHGYFKNINGQIVDEFDVTAGTSAGGSTPTVPLATPTNSNSNVTIPPGTNCAKKNIGNADCRTNTSGKNIDIFDYAVWYSEFIKGCNSTNSVMCGTDADGNGNPMDANFNYPGTNYIVTDNKVDVFDYAIWIQGYLSENPPSTPLPTTPTGGISLIPTSINTPTGIPTASPQITPTSVPIPTVLQGSGNALWISSQEIAALPASGAAWDRMRTAANGSFGSSALYNQDADHPEWTLAAALVAAKKGPSEMCGSTSCQAKAIASIMDITDDTGTTGGGDGRALGLGRNLMAYVIAADVVNLKQVDPAKHSSFVSFLRQIVNKPTTECGTLRECHAKRPNNWGTMTGASRIAADRYMGDAADLAIAAKIFKGFVGDRASYSSFEFGSGASDWMCDTANPRPLNPTACIKSGKNLSGALPDDMRRGGGFTWPPTPTNYAWGAYSAIVAQAELLHRAGYDSYNWEDKAILRAMQFNANNMASSASNATSWVPWVVKKRYGAGSFNYTPQANGGGRLMDWADWTHQ